MSILDAKAGSTASASMEELKCIMLREPSGPGSRNPRWSRSPLVPSGPGSLWSRVKKPSDPGSRLCECVCLSACARASAHFLVTSQDAIGLHTGGSGTEAPNVTVGQ
eukprot:scaffold94634_cov18-Tisochrysis_lutea.AAC.2